MSKFAPLRRRERLLVFGLFLLLAVLFTWPVALFAGRRVPLDLGDPLLTSWLTVWGPEGLVSTPSHLFDAPIFYPHPLAFALTENLLGIGLPLAPLWFATHNAALVGAVALIGSFALNGFTAFLLARELKAPITGSIAAGLIYAFAPYRIAQISHLHVQATFWIPLIFLVLIRNARDPKWWRGALAGLLLALQVWTSLNGGAVAALGVLLALPVLLWYAGRGKIVHFVGSLMAGAFVVVVLLLPVVIPFLEARDRYEIRPKKEELALYSANVQSFLTVPPWHRALRNAAGRFQDVAWWEKSLYPGAIAVVLAAVGTVRIARVRREVLSMSVLLGVGALVIAFGPSTRRAGLPYGWAVEHFPFLNNLRVPTRVWILALLAIGWLAAMAFPKRAILGGVLLALIALDYIAVPIPMVNVPHISAGYRWLAQRSGAVLEIPALDTYRGDRGEILYDTDSLFNETKAMYRQTAHWRPLINGYSSHLPGEYLKLMDKVQSLPDRDVLDDLNSRGVRWVVIHPDELGGTPWMGMESRLPPRSVRLRLPDLLVIEVGKA